MRLINIEIQTNIGSRNIQGDYTQWQIKGEAHGTASKLASRQKLSLFSI